jgi:hypothetical protein
MPGGPRNATTDGRGRTYRWNDETFTSVTTLIGRGVPKPALTYWAAKSVAEWVADHYPLIGSVLEEDKPKAIKMMKGSPWDERDAAADIGTLIHDIAEARVLGLPLPDYEKKHAGFVHSFEMFLDDWKPEYIATEMTVYNRTHRYAGTLDFIAKLPGLGLVLGDYKTSRSGIFQETCLQLAAYAHSEFCGMPNGAEEPMPSVDTCVALNLRPNGYKLHELVADDSVFRTFLYVMQVAQFTDTGKELISVPLSPPESAVAE